MSLKSAVNNLNKKNVDTQLICHDDHHFFFYLSGFNSHKKCGACFTKLYILPLNFIAFYLLLDSSFHYPKTMKTIPLE